MWKRIRIIGTITASLMLLASLSVRAQDTASSEPVASAATEVQEALPAATIVEVVAANEDLSTLAEALAATGLADTLADAGGEFTVLAPTNAAFEQLPEGKLEALMQPENTAELRDILLYHVSPGALNASQIGTMEAVATLRGDYVTVAMDGSGGLTLGKAHIVEPDVEASNGVIHIVDTVMVPKTKKPEEM